MKKVLIIANLCHTSPRVRGLAKYLPEFGWEPIVVTPHCSQVESSQLRIIETPYRDAFGFLRKMLSLKLGEDDIRRQVKVRFGVNSKKSLLDHALTAGGAIFNYPDGEKGWKPFAISEGGKIIQSEDISAIISNSAPVTSHIIAKELKAKYGIPWVADFRDPWSQNHNYSYGPIRQLVDRRLERKTLSKADALVIVSKSWEDKLQMLHKDRRVYAITNGFDPEEVNSPPAGLIPKFTITYTGSIYTGKQEPSKFFAALRGLIHDGVLDPREIEVRFYGYKYDWLDEEVERCGLSNIVKQHGVVPRQIALEKQRESQLLLLLKWEDPEERGVHTGKIFEYLGARRPILATGGTDDVVSELLNATGAGVSSLTVDDIISMLKGFYRDYKRSGSVSYKGEKSEINKYSHRELARQLCGILDSIT